MTARLSGSVKILIGAVAQLVERFHGMEEARGSIPLGRFGCVQVLTGLGRHSSGILTTSAVLFS